MASEPLIIKKRGEDGNKIITVRIREDILAGLDRLANESNYSRNELINIILDYGVKNNAIQSKGTDTPCPFFYPYTNDQHIQIVLSKNQKIEKNQNSYP